jgi:hypothetical protein
LVGVVAGFFILIVSTQLALKVGSGGEHRVRVMSQWGSVTCYALNLSHFSSPACRAEYEAGKEGWEARKEGEREHRELAREVGATRMAPSSMMPMAPTSTHPTATTGPYTTTTGGMGGEPITTAGGVYHAEKPGVCHQV